MKVCYVVYELCSRGETFELFSVPLFSREVCECFTFTSHYNFTVVTTVTCSQNVDNTEFIRQLFICFMNALLLSTGVI
jgi:hypothetical protein